MVKLQLNKRGIETEYKKNDCGKRNIPFYLKGMQFLTNKHMLRFKQKA